MSSLVGQQFEVVVGAVAHGGFCVARHEGRAIFVRHSLPGEKVIVEITEGDVDSRYLRADAVKVVQASPDRVDSRCSVAGPGGCGGCDWQHVSMNGQRRLKASVIEEQLKRLAGLDRSVEVLEVPGSPDGLHWRTRMKFTVDADARAGLRRSRSHEVIALDDCPIAHPKVLEAGIFETTWPGAEAIVVAAPTGPTVETNETSVLVEYTNGQKFQALGPATLVNDAAGRLWRSRVDGFWQVHPAAAQTLVDAIAKAAQPRPSDVVWDLYAGVGLFAGALAGHVSDVVAVETDASACRDAERNLKDLKNVQVVAARVDRWLKANGGELNGPDVVVLDPPRKGAGASVVDLISASKPRVVVYVACDPAALARDVALFAAKGYSLQDLTAFDLFPMTHHIECVAVFRPV